MTGSAKTGSAKTGRAKTARWACGRHVERAREPRRRPEVAPAVLDARVAVELLEEQVRLAHVVPGLHGGGGRVTQRLCHRLGAISPPLPSLQRLCHR